MGPEMGPEIGPEMDHKSWSQNRVIKSKYNRETYLV